MFRALVFDLDDTLFVEKDFVRSGYKAVARHLRMERGEYDRVVPQAKKPMSSTPTAMPSATRAQTADDDVELTDDDRIAARQWGITEKEYVESVRKGRQMARKGELK